jgi:hypothetical protein
MSEEAVPILRESMAIALEISKRAGAAIASEFRAEQLLQQPRTTGSFNGMLLGPGSSPAQSATPTPASTPQ